MKIVVIGGNGLIGAKLVKILRSLGHEMISASRSTGVDATTGKGLAQALAGSSVVVDVSNAPSFDEKTSVEFFRNSGQNLSKAETEAGVKHHIVLSIVGCDRLGNSEYFHAKNIQEQKIKASGIPYSIVQATQFYEFLKSIADSATKDQLIHLPPVLFQPIAADDVASILADVAINPPLNKAIEIAGPNRASFPNFFNDFLRKIHDERHAVADINAKYFGMAVKEDSLVPVKNPLIGPTTLDQWLIKYSQ